MAQIPENNGDYQYTTPSFSSQNGISLIKSGHVSGKNQSSNLPNNVDFDQSELEELLGAFLSSKKEKTLRAYRQDLQSFCEFANVGSFEEAASMLMSQGHGKANLLGIKYKDYLQQTGLSPATINRRLSALRSLVSLAQTIGLVDWEMQVPNCKSQAFRDTRGVGLNGFRRILDLAKAQRNERKAARDTCILRLLFDLALRRSEVASLDYEDVDLQSKRLMLMGKGKLEKSPLTLPQPTMNAIEEWLKYRGDAPGALFYSKKRSGNSIPMRFTDNGLYRMVCKLGEQAGIRALPHGLRHSSITEILTITGGNLRVAQKFARHQNPNTTILYDDNRLDYAGDAAKQLADRVNC